MTLTIQARAETWDLAAPFSISRGTKLRADVVVATVRDGGFEGRGEGVPYRRYGESVPATLRAMEDFAEARGLRLGSSRSELPRRAIARPRSLRRRSFAPAKLPRRAIARPRSDGARDALLEAMPPGAARNAIDCALWDLEALRSGAPVWELAGLSSPRPVVTAYTISLGEAEAMASVARANASRPLLKIKLGERPDRDVERLRVVRDAAPRARLIVDANEGWDLAGLRMVAPAAMELGVELIEQPLPAGADEALADFDSPVALGADESVHGTSKLASLAAKYRVLNIKLDKTGGLTAALAMSREARSMGFDIMVGCMVGTSLGMAPALLLAQDAAFVDLDGPLLLANDRPDGLCYEDGRVAFPSHGGWGQP